MVRHLGVTKQASRAKVAAAARLRREQTPSEALAWELLRGRRMLGLKFRRQQVVQGYVVDFYCAERRLVIELDGAVHETEEARADDAVRDRALEALGLRVVRIRNQDVSEHHLRQVIQTISRSPSPGRERGRGGEADQPTSPSPGRERGRGGEAP